MGELVGRPLYVFRAPESGQTTLVPVPAELSVVRMILVRRRGPKPVSYHRIVAELESSGVPARRGTWRGATSVRSTNAATCTGKCSGPRQRSSTQSLMPYDLSSIPN